MKAFHRSLRHCLPCLPGFLGWYALSAGTASADGLADLNKHLEKYLMIDFQDFQEVSCKIQAPILQALVDQMNTLPPAVRATNTLKDFALTLHKGEKLKVVEPALELTVVDKNGVADPVAVEKGIAMTRTGFAQASDGAAGLVQAVFEDLRPPVPGDRKSVEVRTAGAKTMVHFMRGETKVSEVYEGEGRHRIEESLSGKAESTFVYRKVDGKLAFQNEKIVMSEGKLKGTTDITVTYQKLGALQFPASIVSDAEYEIDGKKERGKVELTFKECSVK